MKKTILVMVVLPLAYLFGCSGGDMGGGSSGGDDACGGCPDGQLCGGGCATDGTVGCYTPGGNPTNPGKWDCPACFRDAAKDGACAGKTFSDGVTTHAVPNAYTCQPGAVPLGGCAPVSGGACCS